MCMQRASIEALDTSLSLDPTDRQGMLVLPTQGERPTTLKRNMLVQESMSSVLQPKTLHQAVLLMVMVYLKGAFGAAIFVKSPTVS